MVEQLVYYIWRITFIPKNKFVFFFLSIFLSRFGAYSLRLLFYFFFLYSKSLRTNRLQSCGKRVESFKYIYIRICEMTKAHGKKISKKTRVISLFVSRIHFTPFCRRTKNGLPL